MLSIRRRLQPKHQVLVLKCYPPPQKNAIEYKPNSSELSYLLYYASTRRSKLRKLGDFLERKTSTDVHHSRIGIVQITLQIVRALIVKCPRDLPLYSDYVLSILTAVLKSHDATMVEESLATWEIYCAHYDPTSLAADHNHRLQYDEVIDLYTSYASKRAPIPQKGKASIPLAQRYRSLGLKAIKSLVSSEPFQTHNERHLRILVPVILQNLDSDQPKYFSLLRSREKSKEKLDKEAVYRTRQSVSLGRSTDSIEADPEDAAATTADLDQKADEEVAVLALQALRHIFTADDHSHLRAAVHAMLHFIALRHTRAIAHSQKQDLEGDGSYWSEASGLRSKVDTSSSYWSPTPYLGVQSPSEISVTSYY
ncbi:MAG: plasma membrane localization protein [Chrysothrix sp. TS-e1954]|nr:MAG: plasma membrane localization protein [Chrysothrix sp. TS-e1954]